MILMYQSKIQNLPVLLPYVIEMFVFTASLHSDTQQN